MNIREHVKVTNRPRNGHISMHSTPEVVEQAEALKRRLQNFIWHKHRAKPEIDVWIDLHEYDTKLNIRIGKATNEINVSAIYDEAPNGTYGEIITMICRGPDPIDRCGLTMDIGKEERINA